MYPEPCGENTWYRYPTGGRVSPDIYSWCFDQVQVSALTVTHYLKLLRRSLVFFILHYSQQLLLALGVTLIPYSRSTTALVWLTLKLCKLGCVVIWWSLLNFLYPRQYLKILDHRQDGLPVCSFFIELYFSWNFLGAERGYFSMGLFLTSSVAFHALNAYHFHHLICFLILREMYSCFECEVGVRRYHWNLILVWMHLEDIFLH